MEVITKKSRGRPAKPAHSLTTKVVDYITRAKDYSRVGGAYAASLGQGVMPHSKLLKLIPQHTAAEINEAIKNALEADLIAVLVADAGRDYGLGRAYWSKSSPSPCLPTVSLPLPRSQRPLPVWTDEALAEKVISHVFSASQYQHMDPKHAEALECGLMPRAILLRVARLPAEALDRGVSRALASGRIAVVHAQHVNRMVIRKRLTTYYTMATDFVAAG